MYNARQLAVLQFITAETYGLKITACMVFAKTTIHKQHYKYGI